MDSVRSEYSDSSSSLGTGRFGGYASHGASSATLSFAGSSGDGSTSRLSTTRSDFLSNYEHKFLARKAEKKKKREREKRLADASSNQLTADDRRRADRERERIARQAEMAAWLPTPAALRQRDRDRKKRSREALRTVLRWYPPLAADEAAPHPALLEQRKRHTEIAPLFAPEASRDAQREQQQRAVRDQIDRDAAALARQVAELQLKMACVERLQADRRRPGAPLAPLWSREATTTTTTQPRRRPTPTQSTSFWFRDTPDEAAAARALEAAELDVFLDAHKRARRRVRAATAIQAAWRMVRARRRFRRWRAGRTRAKRAVFEVWALWQRLARHARRAAVRRCLRAWRDHVCGAVRLRLLELRLFHEAELLPAVPRLVINLVFTADDDDDAYTRKVLAHAMKPSYAAGFVNAAFAAVESRGTRHGVRVLRAQHLEARRAVAKKIGQRVFLLWKRVHAEQRRLGLNAQLCLKRAARQAFQKRPVWAAEKLLTVFELWARWAAFARSKRLGVPMPQFARALPLWDVWLHNYQERQVRKVKAAAKAPLARMKRCFRGFRAFAAFAMHKRRSWARATRHFATTTTRAVVAAWHGAIAESAARKKRLRGVLANWHAHAARKRAMRPWKREVQQKREQLERLRAWVAWRHVQLRSCFKRELHRARLASQPAWRWKVRRLLLVWMDLREQLRPWKCLVAWRHAVQRRKLFLTARAHCHALRRRHLIYGVFSAWKAVVWKQEDEFLEDRLQLSAWDAYKELSPLLPMLFYGCFSDAAAIFAGVRSALTNGVDTVAVNAVTVSASGAKTIDQVDVLARRQRATRSFHEALLQGSVIEARNLVLNQRHLINAVDESTGNTALHVAAGQLEDSVRRIEILTLLLSEGACTWDTRNRHGLTPAQLAPPDEEGDTTRRLLARGVYAFHADGVLARARRSSSNTDSDSPTGGFAESRLVWCLVARMSSEYVRGERVAGDLRREWFSELQDELWLRRGRVCFASASTFTAAIHRCRAFLNGMKRRICRSKDDVLLDLWTRVQKEQLRPRRSPSAGSTTGARRPTLRKSTTRRTLSRDLARMEEKIDLLTWLKNTPDDPSSPAAIQKAREQQAEDAAQAQAHDKAQKLGEYGAYAEALLWPVLHDEAAERALVHSFVGVLFSLAFPADAVLAEATRLELECTQLENDVLQGFQAIMRAELRCRSPELPHGMPLLRYFTEQSDAEFFFKRELLLVDKELLCRYQQRTPGSEDHTEAGGEDDNDAGHHQETGAPRSAAELQLEAEILLAKAQRKQRKVDKKLAASELHVAALADANARVLLREPLETTRERLQEICDARERLEDERLRLASLRLKQLDWEEKASEMLALKRALDAAIPAPEPPERNDGQAGSDDDAVSDSELLAKRAFLKAQLDRYTQELKSIGSSRAGATAAAQSPTTELRQLHKVASRALWTLFVKNLFRSCCFWLAENLLKLQELEESENAAPDGTSPEQDEDDAMELAVADGDDEHGGGDGSGGQVNNGALVVLRRKRVSVAQASAKRVSVATIAEPVTAAVATTFAAARKASAAAHAPAGGGGRRRSSIQNARATLDTMQRSAAATELAEIQTQMMRENYATSSQLLFESDRDAMLEDERLASQREMLEALEHPGRASSAVTELNPITGLPETPSSRLMDAEELAEAASKLVQQAADEQDRKVRATQKRNRKRELLRRAMAQRQLQRLAARRGGDLAEEEQEMSTPEGFASAETVDTGDSGVSCKKWAPLVDGVVAHEDGEVFNFGNFVLGPAVPSESSPTHSTTLTVASANVTHKAVAAAMAESLWKRGGTVRRPGDSAVSAATGGSPPSALASAGSPGSRGGDGSELFASAEDEQAFNTAFRVMSASKERRATPSGRRLSSISAVAGGGLGAVSPREAQVNADDAPGANATDELPSGDTGEGLSTLLAELHTAVGAAEAGLDSDAGDAGVVGESMEDQSARIVVQEEQGDAGVQALSVSVSVREGIQDERLRADLASLVSATDETEFFDQTLQHYLARVRRDSFAGPTHPSTSFDVSDGGSQLDDAPPVVELAVENEAYGAETAVLGDVTDDVIGVQCVDSLRTPNIKWEPALDDHQPQLFPRPLHVESTRLLLPSTASRKMSGVDVSQPENAALLEALREIERKEEDEQRLRQRQGEPLLLSGKTSAMAVRRQKSSVVSTLLKKDKSSSRILHESIVDGTQRLAQIAAGEDKPVSPSVPKVMVAIQRKTNPTDESISHDSPSSTYPEARDEPVSPTRRLSQQQQQPLPLAHCELRLECSKTFSKTTQPTVVAASRRRASQADSPLGTAAPMNLRRQPSKLPAAPADFCLEGASALISPFVVSNPGAKARSSSTMETVSEPVVVLPELTEEQKRNIWRQFTGTPLSDVVQDAYAQLYPHLYEPVTPLPSAPATPALESLRRSSKGDTGEPPTTSSDAATATAPHRVEIPIAEQIAVDRRFWSAVEGFKAVGGGVVPLDEQTLQRRRVESAVAIYQQFLGPAAPNRPAWLSMYAEELRTVERRLLAAPRALFDVLQQTAQLHVSTLQAQQRQHGYTL